MKEINLNHICKIEGHASLRVEVEKNRVLKCELEALEGARFFETIVLNKNIEDVQEIVSRICGICSCAHSVCAIRALEKAIGKKESEYEKIIRNLLLLGERIRSHATHLYFLVLPDYLERDALEITKKNKEEVERAIKIIKFGNKLIQTFGGREIHPFSEIKENIKTKEIEREIEKIHEETYKTLQLFSKLKYPKISRETDFLCLKDYKYYGSSSETLFSKSGKIETKDYFKHLKENIKEYATSKFVLMDDSAYLTGAIVRLHMNNKLLDEKTKKVIKSLELNIDYNNPFHNSLAQAIELYDSVNQVKNLIKELEKEKYENKNAEIKSGRGISAIEAPRGTLFHEYEVDKEGKIIYCNIITPTAQNLNQIEIDIKNYVNEMLKKDFNKEKVTSEIEKLIRSFDPCFSCSTHFLKLDWKEN